MEKTLLEMTEVLDKELLESVPRQFDQMDELNSPITPTAQHWTESMPLTTGTE